MDDKKVVGADGCCDCSGEGCASGNEYEEVYIDDPHYTSREEAVDGLRKVIDELWSVYYRHQDIGILTEIADCETVILKNLP